MWYKAGKSSCQKPKTWIAVKLFLILPTQEIESNLLANNAMQLQKQVKKIIRVPTYHIELNQFGSVSYSIILKNKTVFPRLCNF